MPFTPRRKGKGDGSILCEAPKGPFRQNTPVPFSLERAALSIANNVAEGFERGTTQELLTFLYIARGSAGEVRSMLLLAERLPGFGHLKSQISNHRRKAFRANSALGPTACRTPASRASAI